ncbi:DUF4876 domain-containing protein [Bergeyella cardium]|uniref:DUF4876 domain-containing protein n=1 Tax=Bergeyella cardium TaxID=1585976 RepID=UPI000EA0A2DC|nr:DUF4876 domain-containing protein [Bergeyella cardium]
MKKNRIYTALAILLAIVSCSRQEGDFYTPLYETSIIAEMGKDAQVLKYNNLKFSFRELNTGHSFSQETNENQLNLKLEIGTYEIAVEGSAEIEIAGETHTTHLKGYLPSCAITNENTQIRIELLRSSGQEDFIISEIFFAGSLTNEGKQYDDDKYIRLYNNTDKTLYADGLMISQSEFTTDDKQNYEPNKMNEAFTVTAIIMIPGSGTDHPVKPGEYFLIADTGINHKEYNENSPDLSKADFEFYKEGMDDIDAPNVPNTLSLVSEMVMKNQGNTAYSLSRLPKGVSKEDYLKNYTYKYKWTYTYNGYVFNLSEKSYYIPNEWIVDAVNLSIPTEFQWLVTAPSLDIGYTYTAKTYHDDNRYGKSVKRKTLHTDSTGKAKLRDTNNSSADFTPLSKPSLLE